MEILTEIYEYVNIKHKAWYQTEADFNRHFNPVGSHTSCFSSRIRFLQNFSIAETNAKNQGNGAISGGARNYSKITADLGREVSCEVIATRVQSESVNMSVAKTVSFMKDCASAILPIRVDFWGGGS